MLQSGEKYENYHGPERTCLCSRYHAIYGRDTTDHNEHVFAVYIIQFTVVIPRTRTNMFVHHMFCNHKMYKGTRIRRAAFCGNFTPLGSYETVAFAASMAIFVGHCGFA